MVSEFGNWSLGHLSAVRKEGLCVDSDRPARLNKRKSDRERCTAVISIFCGYHPLVRFNDSVGDGQAHAHAFRFAGVNGSNGHRRRLLVRTEGQAALSGVATDQ